MRRRSSSNGSPRVTLGTIQIIDALLVDAPGGTDWYLLELCRQTHLSSGTVARTLNSLVDRGWLSSYWEDRFEARCQGRPRRRFYRLTPVGEREAKEIIRRKLPSVWNWRVEPR
jgi:PadR family transcriptional regulator, regulatory protein PadR